MKILITGGSGFIGTNLIDFCLNKNATILNIDIRRPVKKEQLPFWKKVNILDDEKLSATITKFNPEYIIHLAARTDLDGTTPEDYSSNTIGTLNLINAINKLDSLKRILFASSMLVCKIGYIPKDFSDYKPNTPYGESKMEMEKIIHNSSLKAEWAIFRPTSIWGPWFNEPYRNFFDIVLKGLFIHPGNKSCTKTYGYVGNSIHQMHQLLVSPKEKVHRNSFYIGDNPPIQISEWADEIKLMHLNKVNLKLPYFVFVLLGILGDLLKIVGIKFPMTSFRLKNMTTNSIINLDHLNNVIGNNPFSRLEGVKATLKWLNNK
jgi:nucleoside-diphosphate-sugar epimerase